MFSKNAFLIFFLSFLGPVGRGITNVSSALPLLSFMVLHEAIRIIDRREKSIFFIKHFVLTVKLPNNIYTNNLFGLSLNKMIKIIVGVKINI
jgi:hypothetical protein